MKKIELHLGDITKLKVDAIVNAANKTLLGGGGVDGAIHRAAGKKLLNECRTLNGCETGDAKITKGYNLPAKFVIHTVGPVYNNGKYNEAKKLGNCYRRSLELANENSLKTVAFPNISTGIYGYPKQEAAEIAISKVKDFLLGNAQIEKVIFCVFDNSNFEIYKKLLQ
ncbi:MAG: O-acetyl-ADP-ribose deacetylase [Draconibacterium sp.]|nr:O-acetyl-ADP-ribose deacetylase [Draconibacterium sp.]